MPYWWEEAYPGGPMVAVKGFPRSLYPPDSEGYDPSVDGSDVEAYKRTVSRAGRWEWQAFDQAYSNAFAHGKSGNVGETGVGGVQRQNGISDTGFIGNQTFNLLRSIRIPAPLPHAGEPAMDARAVELVNAAWERFRGDPSPLPERAEASRARLAKAKAEVGYRENPAQSNLTKYGSWYGMDGQPWCAMFVTWCDAMSGKSTPSFVRGRNYAFVPYIVTDARLAVNGLSITSTPEPGDLVCFDWTLDGEYQHVGLVDAPPNGSGDFTTIEGNTTLNGDQSNGGEVMERRRNRYWQGTVFVRAAA
jgi:hypothetical protein